MSDEHLRSLERRFYETKDPEDFSSWVRARLRAGENARHFFPRLLSTQSREIIELSRRIFPEYFTLVNDVISRAEEIAQEIHNDAPCHLRLTSTMSNAGIPCMHRIIRIPLTNREGVLRTFAYCGMAPEAFSIAGMNYNRPADSISYVLLFHSLKQIIEAADKYKHSSLYKQAITFAEMRRHELSLFVSGNKAIDAELLFYYGRQEDIDTIDSSFEHPIFRAQACLSLAKKFPFSEETEGLIKRARKAFYEDAEERFRLPNPAHVTHPKLLFHLQVAEIYSKLGNIDGLTDELNEALRHERHNYFERRFTYQFLSDHNLEKQLQEYIDKSRSIILNWSVDDARPVVIAQSKIGNVELALNLTDGIYRSQIENGIYVGTCCDIADVLQGYWPKDPITLTNHF